jgi:archaellum biogenesis protein FlaJ (TadC family)
MVYDLASDYLYYFAIWLSIFGVVGVVILWLMKWKVK